MSPRPWSVRPVLHRLLPGAWAAMAIALLLVAVVVLLGMTAHPSMSGAPSHELLGPFRWTPLSERGLA